jgi:hypothetical protein
MTRKVTRTPAVQYPLTDAEKATLIGYLERALASAHSGLRKSQECYQLQPTDAWFRQVAYYQHAGRWTQFMLGNLKRRK